MYYDKGFSRAACAAMFAGLIAVADQVKPEVRRLGGVGPGQAYYDWTAFARVTEARFGNAGFNSLRARRVQHRSRPLPPVRH